MMSIPKLTKEQAAIIGAYTGITTGPFSVIHEYAEKILDRSIFTHQFADKTLIKELQDASKEDFISLCYEDSK